MNTRLVFFLSVALVGCAAGSGETGSGDGGSTSNTGGMGGAGASDGGFVTVGGGSTGGGYANAEVYGHSDDTLYKLDPITKQVTVVGTFNGCTDVIDIAIDKDGRVLGTTFDGLYSIDKATASCSLIAQGTYPNSLSFVPQGTVDNTQEALVGYNVTDYVRINPTTGAMSTLNPGAISGGYESSGDIVSVIDGGTYLTIKGLDCDDCLVEVNPQSGAIIQNYGNAGESQIFGLAYWGGSAYGFTNDGKLVEILFNGSTVSAQPIQIQGAPAGLQFWGAGSSTDVPIEPPQ